MKAAEPARDPTPTQRGPGKGRPFQLSPDQDAVVAAYGTALHDAGLRGDHADIWGARAFFIRFGDIATWETMSLDAQLGVNVKISRFVGWLIGTQQLVPSPDYVVAHRPLLGRVVARSHAEFFAEFRLTAAAVGFSDNSSRLQWSALAQACALSGRRPADLSHEDLDRSRVALCASGQRLGHGSLRSLRTAMFGLEATLFHAGVTDELPRKRVMDKASERTAQWSDIRVRAPVLAGTMTRYVEQVGLSLRPGTTRHHEAVTREFARFVLDKDENVHAAADVRRCHVEDYKAWLAQRPAVTCV